MISRRNIRVKVMQTLYTAITLEKEIKDAHNCTSNIAAAKAVGKLIAARALEKGIKKVAFDRSGFKYHGRVEGLAAGAREAGELTRCDAIWRRDG